MPDRRFWMSHAWIPAAVLAVALVAIAAFELDRRIADALFFDAATVTWIGANRWWAVDLIHTGGALFVRIVGLAALSAWAASFLSPRFRNLRATAGYVVLGLLLVTATVGGLKQVTGVDCPRDVAGYGGDRPYLALLAKRPEGQAQGRCYPGAHASSGFALMAFYFAFRDRRPRLARKLLAGAIATGVVFSIGQQARGAHFLSHDLMSAAMAWFLLLALWYRLLELPAQDAVRRESPAAEVQSQDGTSPRGAGPVSRPATHPAHARRGRTGLRGVLQRLLSAPVPVRAAAPQWRRRGDTRRGAGDARQGHAQDG
jgi:membrane-associated PAP2 superfamily phosphatase